MITPQDLENSYENLKNPNNNIGWFLTAHITSNFNNLHDIPSCKLLSPISKAMWRVTKTCFRYSGWQLTLSKNRQEVSIKVIPEKEHLMLKKKVLGKNGKTDNQLVIWLKEKV